MYNKTFIKKRKIKFFILMMLTILLGAGIIYWIGASFLPSVFEDAINSLNK